MHKSDEEFISILHQKGLKATPQRLAIYRYLANNESHPSADVIYEDIRQDLPTISQGTVYNTLTILTDIGVIRELKIANGHSRYDSNTDVHINLICPDCNNITDYQSNDILTFWKKIRNNITSDFGGEITGQRFDIYRKCDTCPEI